FARAAATTFRGGGTGWRAADLRLLSHSSADAAAIRADGDAVPHARQHPAIRHHLCDDAGRTGRHADGVPDPVLFAGLHLPQYRPLLRDPDGALGDHLRAEQILHEHLDASARTRPWAGLG